jgi:hypothetical protein
MFISYILLWPVAQLLPCEYQRSYHIGVDVVPPVPVVAPVLPLLLSV